MSEDNITHGLTHYRFTHPYDGSHLAHVPLYKRTSWDQMNLTEQAFDYFRLWTCEEGDIAIIRSIDGTNKGILNCPVVMSFTYKNKQWTRDAVPQTHHQD